MPDRQVAIVTGAASGIGRAIALGLLDAGVDVAAVDRDQSWLRALAETVGERRPAGSLHPVAADLAEADSFARIVEEVLGRFGKIDVLVNNAGIGQGAIRPDQKANPIRFWEITPGQWSRFVAVNATAPLMMARAVAPHMMERKRGRIIGVTTSLGTMIRGGFALYGAPKAASEAAHAVMAADLAGSGVTVNVLVPGGMTDTRIIPEAEVPARDRLIRPEVMVPPLLWLISDAARDVTARRFLAVHWNRSLPPAQAADACGAPIAWTSLGVLPIEPE
ncbi:MAG: SDR family oxidoreductase [Rhodospirillales bacterium]|jgi:NAD(P)-dependent dehydrogenase (short-subunit alcohol dehydrogenase family)|nr:SDR family oxidoreductase [Rhodospirillales bacterium]